MKNLESSFADAVEIWNAGVAAVDAERVVFEAIGVRNHVLSIASEAFEIQRLKKIVVVGFGKCSAAMAVGLERALENLPPQIELIGLVNAPEGQPVTTKQIEVIACRSRASNFPTETVVAQTQRMLKLVGDTDAQTLVIALVSGGGSALLEDSWVPLEDLVAVSKSLSAAGAPIESLNTVRRALSRVKAGGFARHVLEHSSASLVGLIISDVIGDDLEMVASGPTVLSADDVGDRRRAAIGVLEKYRLDNGPESIQRFLNLEVPTQIGKTSDEANHGRVRNHLLANNTTAIEAAARYASRKGALVSSPGFDVNRGVEAVAKDWAALAMSRMEAGVAEPLIFLAGGEPTVSLCESPGQGGRNLQLAALVLRNLLESWPATDVPVAFISGGSDGEDGNVSVSGGGFEGALLRVLAGDPSLRELLWAGIAGNDCYTFFDRVGRLLAPSPVSTNVCDIQVMLLGSASKET